MPEDDVPLFSVTTPRLSPVVASFQPPDIESVKMKVVFGDGRVLEWSCDHPLEVEVKTERRDLPEYLPAVTFHDLMAGHFLPPSAGAALRILGGLPYRVTTEAYKGDAKH